MHLCYCFLLHDYHDKQPPGLFKQSVRTYLGPVGKIFAEKSFEFALKQAFGL